LSSKTAVIVTSDHGDEFFEHGFKGHRRTLYREVVQVPLVARVPGMPPGAVIEAPVSLADLMPTILDLAGAPIPAGVDGRSLVEAIAGSGGESAPRRVYADLCTRRRKECQASQASARGTLIHHFRPRQLEYYDAADAEQQHDLVEAGGAWPMQEEMTTLAEQLSSSWAAYRRVEGSRSAVTVDDATRDRLRALGYGE
jgi:arylsulfatase A-like enzyme